MKKALVSALATASVAAPTTVALAADDGNTTATGVAVLNASAVTSAARSDREDAEIKRRIGVQLAQHEQAVARHKQERARKQRERKRARRRAAREQASGASSASPQLQAIAACESGGNPSAIGGGGQFRGKYQFDEQTWQSVGGSGDPAAAPAAEQDRRAAMLLGRSGTNPWPVCGR